jgi:glucosyl-3-phosphoglycerate synthase
MEYVQEQVTTLHDLTDPTPSTPADRAAVVVPMTEREYGGLAAERVLSELAALDPARVVVPIRASADKIGPFCEWLAEFDLETEPLWCNGDRVRTLLDDANLNGRRGKGRDVWLALGCALSSDAEYVVVHDADTRSYDRSYVQRLLFPLTGEFSFVKGYYARVENEQLYGRLFRLFYTPLVRALQAAHDAPILSYLAAFRYALAGEFATTREVAARLRIQRSWGLEVGTLGDAFREVGFEGSAQVDLGTYEHDHRSVGGPTGLSEMSEAVGGALLRAAEEAGVEPDYETLPSRYRETAEELIRSYAADAAFNGLEYDPSAERDQVASYAAAIGPPGPDDRLPAWTEAPLDPARVHEAAAADLADATATEQTRQETSGDGESTARPTDLDSGS